MVNHFDFQITTVPNNSPIENIYSWSVPLQHTDTHRHRKSTLYVYNTYKCVLFSKTQIAAFNVSSCVFVCLIFKFAWRLLNSDMAPLQSDRPEGMTFFIPSCTVRWRVGDLMYLYVPAYSA